MAASFSQVPVIQVRGLTQGLLVSQVSPKARGSTHFAVAMQMAGARHGGRSGVSEVLHGWPTVESGAQAKPASLVVQ